MDLNIEFAPADVIMYKHLENGNSKIRLNYIVK